MKFVQNFGNSTARTGFTLPEGSSSRLSLGGKFKLGQNYFKKFTIGPTCIFDVRNKKFIHIFMGKSIVKLKEFGEGEEGFRICLFMRPILVYGGYYLNNKRLCDE